MTHQPLLFGEDEWAWFQTTRETFEPGARCSRCRLPLRGHYTGHGGMIHGPSGEVLLYALCTREGCCYAKPPRSCG